MSDYTFLTLPQASTRKSGRLHEQLVSERALSQKLRERLAAERAKMPRVRHEFGSHPDVFMPGWHILPKEQDSATIKIALCRKYRAKKKISRRQSLRAKAAFNDALKEMQEPMFGPC